MWCTLPPPTCLFPHHSTPYIQFSSRCPGRSKISKKRHLTGCSSRSCWHRRLHCGRTKCLTLCMPMCNTFISPSVCVCRLFHRTMNSSSHPLFIDAFICHICPTLKTCNVPTSSALRDSRSCRSQYYQKCKTLIHLAVRKVERGHTHTHPLAG